VKSNFTLTIRQKGLLMVLAPLAIQFTFLLAVFFLYKQAEYGERIENRAKRIELLCNRISHLAYSGGASVLMYIRLQDDRLSSRFVEAFSEIRQQVKQLDSLIGKGERERELLSQVKAYSDRTYEVTTEIKKTLDEGADTASLPHVKTLADEMASASAGMGEALRKLERYEISVLNKQSSTRGNFRQAVQSFVLIGVFCNIVAAIVLANFFSKQIANRLMVVVDNTRKLASGQVLNQELPGNDEIAHLDRVFHDSARTMHEAARLRRELISLVSHDLRTPLTAIKLNLSAMEGLQSEPLSEKASSLLSKTQREVNRLIRLIVDLLDLEKMETGALQLKLQEVPLQAVFEDAEDAVLSYAQENNLELLIQENDFTVQIDPERIIQVLVNFLSNAIKFSPPGGKITVSAEKRDRMIRISVKDEGPGIPAEYRESVFDRYKQIESQGKTKLGTGLGLAICKSIILEHHGAIGVDSEPGKGSSFWFEVPAVAEPPAIS
jgi:signal transduction histidine kinase